MMSADGERPREECPACGGSGGGPFGRAGSGWDIESYECPRCEGWGYIREVLAAEEEPPVVQRPGIVKATPGKRAIEEKKKRRAGG
jgi:hypothetical protein